MRSQPLPGEEIVCLLDDVTDNYLLLRLGWLMDKRLHSITLHLRLVNASVNVEQDWTDDFISDLIDAGVDRKDIVFANTTPPEMRNQTELAIV